MAQAVNPPMQPVSNSRPVKPGSRLDGQKFDDENVTVSVLV